MDSDLSEMSDAPDKDILNPNVEVQENACGLQEDAEMETIQEDDEGEESVDEDIQSQETTRSRELSPQKPASRVSNIESVTFSPLAKSAPEQVEEARKNLENTATEYFMPEESTGRYPSRKREAVKRLAMHGGKSYDEHTLAQMICMSTIAEKHAPKRLSLNRGLRM